MKRLQQKRAALRGFPSKEDWSLICSRKGEGLKVKEEDRAKIVAWVQAHPDVVKLPLKQDTILCPDPDDPQGTVRRNKLLLQTSVKELHCDLSKPGIGLPETVMREGRKQLCDTVLS